MSDKTINAPIIAVTVYTDRARIVRRGTIHLPAGKHVLSVSNVPRTLDPDSVRAGGKGPGVKIIGVGIATRHVTEAPDKDNAALQQELETLREKDTVLADEDAAQSERLELLKSLRENSGPRFARSIAAGQANVDTLRPLAHYLTEELQATNARRRDIAKQRRDLEKEIITLEEQLKQTQSVTSREWREIQVAVEATAETNLQLDVTYAVSNAWWEPLYDVRVDENTVTLTYLAQVLQESGEDWSQVALTLSTARPARTYTIPKLSPWYVDKYQPAQPLMPPMPAARMAAPASVPEPGAMAEAGTAYDFAAAPDAEITTAEIESNGLNVTFQPTDPVDVPSDGSPHATALSVAELQARLDYVIVPKFATETYVRARIQNTSALMLLPGKAQIFRGNDFIGTMQIDRIVAPNEEFETQLGLEDRIKVERELTERSTSKALIGNMHRIVIGYKAKITNNMLTPAHVLMYDHMPVSRNPDIKVRLQDSSSKVTEQTDLNILKWEYTIVPNSTREIAYTFVVEYPRDVVVTGLTGIE